MVLIQHTDSIWKTIPYPIATLDISITDLANNLGMKTVRYDDEGLGMTTALLCELSDGLIVGVDERDYLIETQPEPITALYVKSYELRTCSVEKLIKCCLDGFNLTLANINWQVTQETVDYFLANNPNAGI